MIPANTEVTCPVCEDDVIITKDMYEGDTIICDGCDATLVLSDGDLEEQEDDIFEDEDDDDEEEDEAVEEEIERRATEEKKIEPKFRKI